MKRKFFKTLLATTGLAAILISGTAQGKGYYDFFKNFDTSVYFGYALTSNKFNNTDIFSGNSSPILIGAELKKKYEHKDFLVSVGFAAQYRLSSKVAHIVNSMALVHRGFITKYQHTNVDYLLTLGVKHKIKTEQKFYLGAYLNAGISQTTIRDLSQNADRFKFADGTQISYHPVIMGNSAYTELGLSLDLRDQISFKIGYVYNPFEIEYLHPGKPKLKGLFNNTLESVIVKFGLTF